MFNKKEIIHILIAIIILGFVMSIPEISKNYAYCILIASIIIFVNILGKEIAGKYFYVDIENKIFEFQRYWFYKDSKLKKPFPIGIILSFFMAIISLGKIKIMALLQFDGKPSRKKILRKRGAVRKSEVNESDLAFISAWGFYALIILGILGFILKIPSLTKYSIYYGFWNLLPIGQLDGTKLFFGSLINWILLAVIYIFSLIIIIL